MNPVVRKLEFGAKLTDDDRRAVIELIADVRELGPREDVVREGETPTAVHAVLDGFAVRYKMLPDGGRQIVGWLVPGDFCDLYATILGAADHGTVTLSRCLIARVPQSAIEALSASRPALQRAFWWSTLVDEGVLRAWMVGMGRRPAHKQIAHLLCELLVRLRSVGQVSGLSFEFPVTQEELADTVGMSPVHVNRVLQQLKHEGLIAAQGRTLTILDERGLCDFAGFDPRYLHRAPRHAGASIPTAKDGASG